MMAMHFTQPAPRCSVWRWWSQYIQLYLVK